jgi:CheY-like chemotaxis protein
MKILVIEDDPTSLKLAGDVLQMSGHVVALATSADQAITSIRAIKPDVILLDLQLPAIKGLAVARQCKDEVSSRDIPIIAVTAFPLDYAKDDAIKAGCDAYILKPINTRTLSGQIASVVAAKSKSLLHES